MRSRPRFLSKSKLMSARQCLKRLYLEIHRPDLVQHSSKTEAAFEIGNQVGKIAHSIYGSDDSIHIPYEGGLTHALKKSRRLLAQGPVHLSFEATI